MKKSILSHLLVWLFVSATFLQAGTQEELVRLQNDIITLQNQFREYEKIYNENSSGLKNLVEQLNDQVAKSNMLLDEVLAALQLQASGSRSDIDAMSPKIQALSGKIEEMLTSLSALSRQVSEMKIQSQPVGGFAPSGPSSSDATFNQALNDLIGGNPELAIQGFNAYLDFFPSGDKATAARYYIGEAYYNMNRFPEAVEAFTLIIEENADSGKVASALFKRGKSALEIHDTDAAIRDFQNVIQRFPDAPEASLSKAELQSLGALNPSQPRKP